MWTSVIHAVFKHTSSTHKDLAVELASRSLVRASSTALRHVRELELPIVVACLAIIQVLWCLTHHMLVLHRLDEICVPLQVFMST